MNTATVLPVGIAPAALKDSFEFESLVDKVAMPSESEVQSLAPDQAIAPAPMLVSGCWWLTRGIELSFARVEQHSSE